MFLKARIELKERGPALSTHRGDEGCKGRVSLRVLQARGPLAESREGLRWGLVQDESGHSRGDRSLCVPLPWNPGKEGSRAPAGRPNVETPVPRKQLSRLTEIPQCNEKTTQQAKNRRHRR